MFVVRFQVLRILVFSTKGVSKNVKILSTRMSIKLCLISQYMLTYFVILIFQYLSMIKFFQFYYLLFFLLCNIVLILPYIDMNPPWVYMCSPS